ncbi:MAG: DUF63 family protein [DPANN group archaeon]|nr:DUF63 family protein [DPANN group archaeon]
MVILDFLNTYFISPIYHDEGYNYINTIVYGLVALGALYGIFRLLQRLKIPVDKKFMLAILPFILFGSSLRVFVDHNIYKIGFWTVAPGIYIMTAAIFFVSLLACWFAFRENYWKACALLGLTITAISFILVRRSLSLQNLHLGFLVLGLAMGISLFIMFLMKNLRLSWFSGLASWAVAGHMIDAAATFVAVDFLGFVEKHPLPRLMSDVTGTAAVMFLLKLAVLLPAIYFINTDIKNENAKNFLFISIATLGLAEGIRDLIAIVLA